MKLEKCVWMHLHHFFGGARGVELLAEKTKQWLSFKSGFSLLDTSLYHTTVLNLVESLNCQVL